MTVNQRTNQRDYLRLAACTAIGLHSLFLVLAPWTSGSKNWRYTANTLISVTLGTAPTEIIQQADSLPPMPKIAPNDELSNTPLPAVEASNRDEKSNSETVKVISAATLEKWSKLETEQLLKEGPEGLSTFNSTFDAPIIAAKKGLASHQDAYGDTRIITHIGDKKVCYLQSKQHAQDDWVKGLVMFYDCRPKEKFILELP